MNWIIGIGVVLIGVILFMIFRISTLVSLIKEKKEKENKGGTSNKVNALLLLVFMVGGLVLFFWYSYTRFDKYTLPIASVHGQITDNLFWITMVIVVISFTIIFVTMFWFTYAYQYREDRKAVFFADHGMLELLWTLIPAVVMALLIFRGLRVWSDMTGPASKDAIVIEIVGQQFAWTARYPGAVSEELGKIDFRLIDASNEFGLDLTDPNGYDDFKSLSLHLPVNREVFLKIRAKDVLHSVFLPHFRVKMDAVPGMQTSFKFIPNKTTEQMRIETKNPNFNYEMACTEICGKGHFSMRFPVIVEEEKDFLKWRTSQNTWLKQNPEYMKYVPSGYQDVALRSSGILLDNGAVDQQILKTVSKQ